MTPRALIKTGFIGGIVAAICCATPILAVALGALGLSAWAAEADYVLIPIILASIGLVGFGLYRRHQSASSAAVDCCTADGNTRELRS